MNHAEVPGMNREERLRRWVDSYSDAILRTCFLYLTDAAAAEDALQDTWIKAWRAMEAYERQDVQHEKAWLMRIAVNTCRDYRRTAWFRHIDRHHTPDDLPSHLMRSELPDHSLSLLVTELPVRYREVILLYYYQGLTQRETAEALGLSPSAVIRRLRSAEKLLKQQWIGGEVPDESSDEALHSQNAE